MSLQSDLLKHTIFLQRLAARESQKLVRNIKEMSNKLISYGNPYNSLKIRNNIKKDLVNKIDHDAYDIYKYERKFIRRLINKHEKNHIK